jgi:predicted DsbA family dithiol-disulfide isomerase
VLSDIAAAHGFNRDEVRSIALDPALHQRIEHEAANSAAAGVYSVPHFIFDNRLAINGGRSEDEIADAINKASQVADRNR